jgi:hypothetical protein
VDSAYLAVRAADVLGRARLAVTADSESLAEEQRGMAREIAERFSLRHRFVRTEELANPAYARNDRDRLLLLQVGAVRAPRAAGARGRVRTRGLRPHRGRPLRRAAGPPSRPRRRARAPRSPKPA